MLKLVYEIGLFCCKFLPFHMLDPWSSLVGRRSIRLTPKVKRACNVAINVLHIFKVGWYKHNSSPLGPIQPSSPSTKELHAWSNEDKTRERKVFQSSAVTCIFSWKQFRRRSEGFTTTTTTLIGNRAWLSGHAWAVCCCTWVQNLGRV